MGNRFFAAFATCSMWSVSAVAASYAPDTFIGKLREQGVDFSLAYLSETATNVRGGTGELWRYADQWTFGATLDLQKLIHLDQASFQITITDRNGRSLSSDANLRTLLEVQEIYGRGQTWRWTQFEYRQTYLDGLLDWKIGRLVGGEDFADFSCDFLNLTFCGQASGNIAGDYWYTWPVSQWATRLKVAVGKSGYLQLGVFEANPRYLDARNGLNIGEPGGAVGTMIPLEFGWQTTSGDRTSGSYKLGVWYNTSKAPDVVDGAHLHHGHAGAYLNLLQNWQGLSVFLNVAAGDHATSTIDNQLTTGLFRTGPLVSRPQDQVGLAVGRTHVNSRTRGTPSNLPTSEYAAEFYYSVHIATGLDIRPSIQFVHWQNAPEVGANTWVCALRLSFTM
jgi:porin